MTTSVSPAVGSLVAPEGVLALVRWECDLEVVGMAGEAHA